MYIHNNMCVPSRKKISRYKEIDIRKVFRVYLSSHFRRNRDFKLLLCMKKILMYIAGKF